MKKFFIFVSLFICFLIFSACQSQNSFPDRSPFVEQGVNGAPSEFVSNIYTSFATILESNNFHMELTSDPYLNENGTAYHFRFISTLASDSTKEYTVNLRSYKDLKAKSYTIDFSTEEKPEIIEEFVTASIMVSDSNIAYMNASEKAKNLLKDPSLSLSIGNCQISWSVDEKYKYKEFSVLYT